jgi:hypothetical protein
MRASALIAAICGLVLSGSLATAQRAADEPTLHVFVDVPDSPGTKVTLAYLEGPDSLRGKKQELVVPTDFVVHGQPLTLLAERTKGHGWVRLRVEQVGTHLMVDGTGDRVRIVVSDEGVQVRAFPWWVPL